jgi:arylsulfatase A-like enzyme
MSWKKNLSLIYAAAAIAAMAFVPAALHYGCARKTAEPNIVFILIDTLRADHLPFYGYEKNTAPFLSELASHGAVFENAFSASSWTGPSTASIYTSMYPFQHGVTTGFFAGKRLKLELNCMPTGVKTIPELLKEDGYATYSVANNPNICEEEGFTRGFDKHALFKSADEQAMTRQLEDWSGEIKAQKKYFLYIHYNDCHMPYTPHEPWYEPKADEREDAVSRYDSEINYVDEKIRKMYELFGWGENTLLIVTADHGEEFWEHGGFGHGKTLYSEMVHVPLLFCFPGRDTVSKRIQTAMSNIDILPTIRHYLGIEGNKVEEGIDVLPLIRGDGNYGRDRYIFSHLLKHNPNRDGTVAIHRATIYHEWEFISADIFQQEHRTELFNMKEDPREQDNVLDRNPALADRLNAAFTDFEKTCKKFQQESRNLELDKDKMEELKSLGYVQ